MNRNEFLRTLAGAAIGAASPRSLHAQAQPQLPAPETVVYKTAQGCDIKAEVIRAGEGARKPGLMYIHGGALIMGSRRLGRDPMVAALVHAGYVIVSVDYRLAPNAKVPSIIEDIQDAWRWVRKEGSRRFGIDADRLAVAGGSAGGYLTLMSGFCLDPRPKALVSYYGYGDIDGPWLVNPDEFYRRQPLVPKEEALASVGTAVISEQPAGQNRGRFYLYCRQQGIWPNEVSGHDPHREPKWFDRYCPIRNVTKAYSPALLIHGTADTDVPYDESKMMAARLAQVGVEHEFITIQNAGHGLSGGDAEEKRKAHERAVEWVRTHTS